MKLYAKISLLLVFCLLSAVASAQSVASLMSKAEKKYKDFDYNGAIELYEQILAKETKPKALFRLPELYRRTGNYIKAEFWYAKATQHPEAPTSMLFYLGLCQLSNDKVDEARGSFQQFKELESAELRAHNLINACKPEMRQEYMNAGALYDIVPLPQLNTKYDDLGANFFGDGLVFSSDRDTAKITGYRGTWIFKPYVQSYYVDAILKDKDTRTYSYGIPTTLSADLNLDYHDGPISFDGIQQTAYYTKFGTNTKKSNRAANNLNTQIAISKRVGEQWSQPITGKKVGVNSAEYSVAFPCVTSDGGKLYFASDIPGGFGGYDLYVSYNESGEWSKPVNLGPEINTEGDEIYPFIDLDDYLYFSSDGQAGLGGFDIYYSRSDRGRWDPAVNLGAPINSMSDDVSFVTDSTSSFGYFSSNRAGGRGKMDIYGYKRVGLQTEVLVFDKVTGKGLEGVVVTSECLSSKTKYVTNVDGRLFIPLPLERNCKLMLSSDEFDDTERDIATTGYAPGAELFINAPIQVRDPDFSLTGVIKNTVGEPLADATITLVNGCGEEQQVKNPEYTGSYGFVLQPNCSYVLKVERAGYFTTTKTFTTRGVKTSKVFLKDVIMPRSSSGF